MKIARKKTEPMTNRELRRLIRDHKLKRREVQAFVMCKTVTTVDRWLLPYRKGENPNWRRMPEAKLELMKLKLISREQKADIGG